MRRLPLKGAPARRWKSPSKPLVVPFLGDSHEKVACSRARRRLRRRRLARVCSRKSTAGTHEGLQLEGGRQKGRRAQEVHERVLVEGEELAAGEDEDLQREGRRDEGRRAQEVHERVPEGRTRLTTIRTRP